MLQFDEQKMLSLFNLAGFNIKSWWELPNYYWQRIDEEIAKQSPHWLVKTKKGLIKIGWRKRVLEIDWFDTGVKKIVTEHNVTKTETMVHAWSIQDAITYLQVLEREINKDE